MLVIVKGTLQNVCETLLVLLLQPARVTTHTRARSGETLRADRYPQGVLFDRNTLISLLLKSAK